MSFCTQPKLQHAMLPNEYAPKGLFEAICACSVSYSNHRNRKSPTIGCTGDAAAPQAPMSPSESPISNPRRIFLGEPSPGESSPANSPLANPPQRILHVRILPLANPPVAKPSLIGWTALEEGAQVDVSWLQKMLPLFCYKFDLDAH